MPGLSVGSHTVSFTTVSGWNTPSSQTATVANNATTTATVTYAQQFGALQVTITPAGAVSAGAQWQVDGGAPQNSGATVTSLTVGSHTVTFTSVSGWITPASQYVTVGYDGTATSTGIYAQPPGSLQVTITPAGAVSAGAQWQVDGGTPQPSGATVANLAVGSHTVSFTTISGWTTPASQTVSITTGQTTAATGSYVQQFGSLQVTIAPAGAVSAGAQWQVDGGTLQTSGATVTNLAAGSHTVSFTTVSGWTTPASQIISVASGQTNVANGNYVQQFGCLQVTILPADAAAIGAQWQVDGGTPQNSGATVTNLAVGSHTVTFTSIYGWTTPASQTVAVTANATNMDSGTFVEQFGSLQVTIVPAGAVAAGAQWELDAGPPQNSGTTMTNLPLGNHTLSFTTVNGWTTPPNQAVVITNNMITATGTYVQQFGSVEVTLSPTGAISAGALWQLDGGTPQNSGRVLANIPAGTHTVSFTTVSGWMAPTSQTFSVTANNTSFLSGTYTQPVGSLQVTITPPGAVSAGAQWIVDGGPFENSGVTVTNLTVGYHTVIYAAVYGWTPPASQTVFVSTNTTTTTNGTYTAQQYGALQVTLTPPAVAAIGGVQWQVDSRTPQNSGATVTNLTLGSHTVTFTPVTGWITPASQTITVNYGATTTAIGAYVQQFGSLQATIAPADAIADGAQWQLDSGPLLNSGATVTNLSVGTHTVSFTPLSGWLTPVTGTVYVYANATATTLGTYIQQTAALQVTISPAGANAAGAQWDVDGGAPQLSGATVTNLTVGGHRVYFLSISGWTPPLSQVVTLSANATNTATGTYVAETGSLQISIVPSGAVSAGAQWQLDGGAPQNSGITLANVPVGNHTVSFTPVSGWTTPSSQSITVNDSATASSSGTYVQQVGSLQVTIAPAGAVSAGAQWQVDGGAPQNSGATVGNLVVGAHTVTFITVSNWTTPASQMVAISNNVTTTLTGTYLLNWSNPAAITYGTALGASQLNASSGGLDGTLAKGGIGGGHLQLTHSPLAGAAAYNSFLPVMQVVEQLKVEVLDWE